MIQNNRTEIILIVAITLCAFGLRLWQLDSTPPGWRDDELINSLVISQHVLDGEWALYFPDASGHEALYHTLNAAFLHLFGATVWGIRYLSVLLGTLAIPLTYLLGKKLFGPTVGLVAAAALAASFWALMYSRIGLRHITMTPLTLAAFYFFWRGFEAKDQRLKMKEWRFAFSPSASSGQVLQSSIFNFSVSAVFIGLTFYTYFASRGLPLILAAFVGYAALTAWPLINDKWRGLVWLFGLALLLALPLFITLGQQPEAEARVGELAVPLIAARAGDFGPLLAHVSITLGMFWHSGDGEWLYNIPDRPVLTAAAAVFFWLGVVVTAVLTFIPLWHTLRRWLKKQPARPAKKVELASAFLLLWWLAGISPAFISVPPASLGHTIVAQPAVFLLAAVPLGFLEIGDGRWGRRWQKSLVAALGLLLVVSIAARDWPDYFQNWPERGMVRFLYRADLHELAGYVNENEALTDFGVTSLLAGPWDQQAFAITLKRDTVRPRWFNAERAVLLKPSVSFTGYPETTSAFADAFQPTADKVKVGGYTLTHIDYTQGSDEPHCFENGLCLETAVYHPDSQTLDLTWQVSRALDLPEFELISNPPPPGVYAGPRLLVFAQLLNADGSFLMGDDGLWVDVYSLQPGDVFKQQHRFAGMDVGAETAVFGLYDPMTGVRILTESGEDHVKIAFQ
ncbi:MAG: glycosyltransferase family 39 protein [Chloroflexota bacterium]